MGGLGETGFGREELCLVLDELSLRCIRSIQEELWSCIRNAGLELRREVGLKAMAW